MANEKKYIATRESYGNALKELGKEYEESGIICLPGSV